MTDRIIGLGYSIPNIAKLKSRNWTINSLFVCQIISKNLLACLPVLKVNGKLGPNEGELNIVKFVERQFPNVTQLDVCKLTTCLL